MKFWAGFAIVLAFSTPGWEAVVAGKLTPGGGSDLLSPGPWVPLEDVGTAPVQNSGTPTQDPGDPPVWTTARRSALGLAAFGFSVLLSSGVSHLRTRRVRRRLR